MEDKPFKFDPVNPRLVTNAQKNNTVYYGAAAIFLISLRAYHRRVFRIDQNSLNLAGFTAASALTEISSQFNGIYIVFRLASYSYASFFLDSAENEAGLINNDKELQRA